MKLHLPADALRAAGLHPPIGRWEQDAPGRGRGRAWREGGCLSHLRVPPPQGAWESLAGSPWSPLLRLYSLGYIFCVFLKQGGREGE